MAKRTTKKADPITALKDEVARLALEGAERALRAAQGTGAGPNEGDEAARERSLIEMAGAYVEIAERARNIDEPY